MAKEFISNVPSDNNSSGSFSKIVWDAMTIDHVSFWQAYIYESIKLDATRADRKWNWQDFFLGLVPFYGLRRMQPKCLVALTFSDEGNAVPIGMLFMLTRYPKIDSKKEHSVYTYFLSSAPEVALNHLGVKRIPNLGRYLIDAGLVLSENLNLNGNFWLHCAPEGGDKLMNFYSSKCKLINFEKTSNLSVKYPKNDGRYFHSSKINSDKLLLEFDHFR